jgi:ketosteroid isomerase-like protein
MHRVVSLLGLVIATPSCAASSLPPPAVAPAVPSASPSPPPPSPAAALCAVWNRENSFARSVHDHDAQAFAEHVQPGAIFVGGDGVTQGRDAIVKAWAGIVRGETVHLEWHPTSVLLTGDPRVALSRGPYWMERTRPDAKEKLLGGVFQSVWVRDADGAWRVLIDGGTPEATPMTEEQLAKVKAGIPAACPGG